MENFIFLCSEWQQNWKTVLYFSTIKIVRVYFLFFINGYIKKLYNSV